MKKLIGYVKNSNSEPEGYILTRMTDDKGGRPISFVFAGKTAKADGSEHRLYGPWLKKSVNYQQVKDGFAYPLYYNTLFAELRNVFNEALKYAKGKKLNYWKVDKSTKGVTVNGHADLATIDPIWPKLWRRLHAYLVNNPSLAGFHKFLEDKNERLDILSTMEEQGLQDVVKVNGNRVRMTETPENLRVRAKAGKR